MRVMRAMACVTLLLSALPVEAARLSCASATTLEALVTCVRGQMPRAGSGGFLAPTGAQQAEWRRAVRQMLGGSCDFKLSPRLRGIAETRTLVDETNGQSYCVLMEVLDVECDGTVDRGWGTFIVNSRATRELSQQAPHPIADSTTDSQAVAVFKGTDSRSFLMAGLHRGAGGAGVCQPAYGTADPAHSTENMFHATNLELRALYGTAAWNAIQWHGMASDSCATVEAYLSHGRAVAPAPTDWISLLSDRMQSDHPTWRIATPGGGICNLNATNNTQGRLFNGVDAAVVCETPASSHSGIFIHIEQDPGFRRAEDWIPAVNATWPARR